MTHQGSDTLFPVESLPGDAVDSRGQRSRQSKWSAMKLTLEVTQEDIDRAMVQNSHSCMIAEAIKRQVPGAKAVAVDIATIRFTDTVKERRVLFLTPVVAQNGLSMFDLGVKPKPFKFSMRTAQITTITKRPKVDAQGKPVLAPARKMKDSRSGKEYAVSKRVEQEYVPPPRARIEPHPAGELPTVLGGKMPPHNRGSRMRKFGARGFTWLDDENPEEVIKRQRLAYGVIEPADGDTPSD